jgi:GxxExxY protein
MLKLHHEDAKTRSPDEEIEGFAAKVVDAAYQVHKALGPGLLESVYQACLAHEFSRQGLAFEQEVSFPIRYQGLRLESGLRLDLVVEGCIIIELKAVEALLPIHTAQMVSCLKITGHPLGFLINFNVPLIKDGIRRHIRQS